MQRTAQTDEKTPILASVALGATSYSAQPLESNADLRQPTGLFLLDWDETIVTRDIDSKDPLAVKILDQEQTLNLFQKALAAGIDIHIVTARATQFKLNEETHHMPDYILQDLTKLGVVNQTHNADFWKARIHCMFKNTDETAKIMIDGQVDIDFAIAHRKKRCVEDILAKHPNIPAYFCDDNPLNCMTVAEDNDNLVPVIAKNTQHLNELMNAVHDICRTNFLNLLNAYLNMIYPNRNKWGETASTSAATGIQNIHGIIFGKQKISYNHTLNIQVTVKKRLGKNCCLTLFGRRPVPVQKLYSILEDLSSTNYLESLTQICNALYKELNPGKTLGKGLALVSTPALR